MSAFYNEPDPYAAQWLRNLIAAGYIAPGIVDTRPIQEIEAWELEGFTQCHFFAGIGIWSLALRRAGWSDDRPIWTGSCPCQPFSAAGQRKGISDERHLWPFWIKLIEQRKPSTVIGEQVASKDGLGWLDLVQINLEAAGYAFGASDLCAAGFQGVHIRQRLYFVGLGKPDCAGSFERQQGSTSTRQGSASFATSDFVGLADDDARLEGRRQSGRECSNQRLAGSGGVADRLADDESQRRERSEDTSRQGRGHGSEIVGATDRLADAAGSQWERFAIGGSGNIGNGQTSGRFEGDGSPQSGGETDRLADAASGHSGAEREQPLCNISDGTDQKSDSSNPRQIASRWLDVDWLLCRNPVGEPSWRPVEPGTFPLDNATTSRMGKLRAYGNGLDAETATAFCQVVREIVDDLRPLTQEYDL